MLKREREKKQMGQTELARLSGVSQQAISLIEKGERSNPGIETLYALAVALDCKISDLYVPDQKDGR